MQFIFYIPGQILAYPATYLCRKLNNMFSNSKRINLRQRVTANDISAEVRNLKAGEVLIVKITPGSETIGESAINAFYLSLQDGRKVLYHSLEATTTQVVRNIFGNHDPDGPLFGIIEGTELNVNRELSDSRPDLYIIDAAEQLGDRAQDSDGLAHDLLVYYAVKFNTAIVAFVRSRTGLSGGAEYEYDLYGREMVLDIERTPHHSSYYSANYYARKIASKYAGQDYYKEFRRLLSRFIKLIELDDEFVRKSIKGYCFENVFALDEELGRFETAHPDELPLYTRQLIEQMHTQVEFLGDWTGFIRQYFGLGIKPVSFRRASNTAGSFYQLKSAITMVSHLFINVAGHYLKELQNSGTLGQELS